MSHLVQSIAYCLFCFIPALLTQLCNLYSDFQISADSTKLVLGSGDICLHCFMKNLFKKQSAKFVQNPSSFTKVMVKHILVCFLMPQSK